MKTFTVILPWPDSRLLPNRANGTHWSKTSALRKEARKNAWATACGEAKGFVCPAGDIALSIVFVQQKGKKRDLDGCLSSAKAYLDGIADALGIDDSKFRPIMIDRQFGEARVIVTITAIETTQPQMEINHGNNT